MAGEVTFRVDTSELRRMLPEVAELTGRTLQEQCVTSVGWICYNAQKETPYVDVSRIDAELDVDRTPVRKGGGSATNKFKAKLGALPWTEGMMIALQRTNPDSPFSRATGNRWPLAYPGGLKGQERWRFFQQAAERMKSARHSSTHFLQAGWKVAVKKCFSSPFFKHSKQYRGAPAESTNPLNSLDSGMLGGLSIVMAGKDCSVTAENDVGEQGTGNVVLDDKHREALIKYGAGPLAAAIEREASTMDAEIDKRLNAMCSQVNARL